MRRKYDCRVIKRTYKKYSKKRVFHKRFSDRQKRKHDRNSILIIEKPIPRCIVKKG